MLQLRLQQRSDIRFCVHSGLTQNETKLRLEAIYGRATLSQPTIHRWWTRFWSGEQEVRDRPRPGATLKRTAEKIQEVRDFVDSDPKTSVSEVTRFCDVSKETAHTIIRKDLHQTKCPAKWLPHNLTQQNKERQVHQARAALQMV